MVHVVRLVTMTHRHVHNVPSYLIELPAGQNDDTKKFQQQYEISVEWNLNCTACCWTYLTQYRKYQTRQGDDTQVTFGEAKETWTQCFISPKQDNSKHGQFKTDNKSNDTSLYGRRVPGSLIKRNSTIRLYSVDRTPEPTVIGSAINVVARIESIGVPSVEDHNVKGSCLSYSNAAILELYREKKMKRALQGVCETEQQEDSEIHLVEHKLQSMKLDT